MLGSPYGEPAHQTALELIDNINAMELAIGDAATVQSFGIDEIVAIHARLMQHTPNARLSGRVRTQQNWIGGRWRASLPAESHPILGVRTVHCSHDSAMRIRRSSHILLASLACCTASGDVKPLYIAGRGSDASATVSRTNLPVSRDYRIDASDYAFRGLPVHAPAGWLTLTGNHIHSGQHASVTVSFTPGVYLLFYVADEADPHPVFVQRTVAIPPMLGSPLD